LPVFLVGIVTPGSHFSGMPLAPFNRARLQASAACVGTAALWWWRGGPVPATLAGIMAALAVLAWAAPAQYAPVQRTLDRLGLVYFLIFAPLRFVRSLTGRDPLSRAPDPAAVSYLQPPRAGPVRFDRQF
jgi:hypothetical protein